MKTHRSIRCFTSNVLPPQFNKGKLSMQKLKDKATIDGHIDYINLLFPDQFGRIHSLKLEAEHFIEEHKSTF